MITDATELSMMGATDLWDNYLEAMDAVIASIELEDRPEAMFYMAVVKVTLDMYFEAVERVLCRLSF